MARSRRGTAREPIPMQVWSADQALKARVDAAAWLGLISASELRELIADDWCGRGRELAPIQFYLSRDEEVATVADYAGQAHTELCFAIDQPAAMAWLCEHRRAVVGAAAVFAEAGRSSRRSPAGRSAARHPGPRRQGPD